MRAKWLLLLPVVLLSGLFVLPAPAADEPTKAQLALAQNNLKQIGIAIHNYASTNDDKLVDDITSKDGVPLLSWRVAILPYIEQDQLYKQFKLDEAWNSAHNKKLLAKMPKLFAPVRGKAKEGETFYQRFVGKDALWNEKGTDYKIGNIPDGTSNTAMVVEAGNPIAWTQPTDLMFNPKAPLPGLGAPFDGDFHILMGDGSVYRFKKNFDADEMKKAIMPADGFALDFKKLTK
jgi:hypothetical protein